MDFVSTFTSGLASAVSSFQSFAKLPVTGKGDFSTWASLLISYGDPSRNGEACDGVTLITPARAATLKAQGIKYVGRYLAQPDPTPPDDLKHKEIQSGELKTIADNGLRCFPIYQTYGREADGFTYPLGRAAGQAAINAALDHGFKAGTQIFWAVDFDALDEEVTHSFNPPRTPLPDTSLDSELIAAMRTDVGKYMESIGFPNDGGLRSHTHEECFRRVVLEWDSVTTLLAYRYKMRKALIQTTAYWEMRHIDAVDLSVDQAVSTTFNTTGYFKDSSTGIAQVFGNTALLAWNHAVREGYAEGTIRGTSDEDKCNIWDDCRYDEQFAMSTVPLIHMWNADGAPGNVIEEEPLRPMRLDYTESEIFQILRRYQGSAESEATPHAKQRTALYQIMEKYNSIVRNG
ncbi:glycoside hydrolase domain-containing protein [Streptomyces phaeochromogenes]